MAEVNFELYNNQLVQQLVGGESVVPRQTAQNFPVCQ